MIVMDQMNATALLVREETLQIRYKDRTGTFHCKVFFDLGLNNSLAIEPQESLDGLRVDMSQEDSFFVSFQDSVEPTECYATDSKLRVGGDQPGHFFRLSPHRSNVILRSGAPLVRIQAGILNFAYYFLTGKPDGQCFELRCKNWRFSFVPIDERIFLYPPQIHTEEYVFTHHVTIQKLDGTEFSPEEARRQLDLLGDFLTFCRGFWVSTALTVGIGADGTVVMEEFGTRKASPKKVASNWLDFHHGNCMVELFPKFVARMADTTWREALRHALYWYVRADTNLVGPDGGCFLLQAALERLAWHVLVRDRQSLSEDGFSRLPAADQLRLLLSAMNVPLGIPSNLAELQRIGRALNWHDGPQAFVGVRNRLVHPPKLNSKDMKLPYFEAYTLGKWYVELALLSVCGYTGKYSNRTKIRRWVGEVEDVPWV
ncbi:MAG TPA: hypothetical protein VMF91_27710 [Bryobacteraceae bacterium]|nr:hypothetical protein [Bryobacteraceae bacterium]